MAAGVVVSRGSPGMAVFSSGSVRSRRKVVSPMRRAKAVTAAGPPSTFSSRLAAALSLYCMVAAHISFTVMPVARCFSATGECDTRSPLPTLTRRPSRLASVALRSSTAAASTSLKVLHSGKRSCARCCRRAPLPVWKPDTPRRPPQARSSSASCVSASDCAPFFGHALQAPASGVTAAASNRVRRWIRGFMCVRLSFREWME
ncbi:hypothetical protein D9M72_415260 [compost metagenome]